MRIHDSLIFGAGVLAFLFLARESRAEQPTGATRFTKLTDVPNSYTGQADKIVKVNTGEDGLSFIPMPIPTVGITRFTELTDVPSSYTGQANNMVTVNPTEDGLSFMPIPVPPAGVTRFIDLTDVPGSYTGQENNVVTVNPTGTGLIFATPVIPPTSVSIIYTGDSVYPRQISHSLGKKPEMIVIMYQNNTYPDELYCRIYARLNTIFPGNPWPDDEYVRTTDDYTGSHTSTNTFNGTDENHVTLNAYNVSGKLYNMKLYA